MLNRKNLYKRISISDKKQGFPWRTVDYFLRDSSLQHGSTPYISGSGKKVLDLRLPWNVCGKNSVEQQNLMIKHGYKHPKMTSNCVMNQPSPSSKKSTTKTQRPGPVTWDPPRTKGLPSLDRNEDAPLVLCHQSHPALEIPHMEKKTVQDIYVTLPPPRPFVPETLFLNICASSSVIFRCYRF